MPARSDGARRRFSRRRLLGSAVCALGLGALAAWQARRERRRPVDAQAIRPPGALAETDFAAACIRCGLCVQACPFHTLKLADALGPVADGTPYFRAREIPCEMCAGIPCQRACPTGALTPALMRIEAARMGTAVLARPEACYSFIGAAVCTSCYLACPLKGRAIVMRPGRTRLGGMFTPTVDAAVCTGCGKCEKACIEPEAAIRVVAAHAA